MHKDVVSLFSRIACMCQRRFICVLFTKNQGFVSHKVIRVQKRRSKYNVDMHVCVCQWDEKANDDAWFYTRQEMTRMLDLVMITGRKGMMIRMEKWSEWMVVGALVPCWLGEAHELVGVFPINPLGCFAWQCYERQGLVSYQVCWSPLFPNQNETTGQVMVELLYYSYCCCWLWLYSCSYVVYVFESVVVRYWLLL